MTRPAFPVRFAIRAALASSLLSACHYDLDELFEGEVLDGGLRNDVEPPPEQLIDCRGSLQHLQRGLRRVCCRAVRRQEQLLQGRSRVSEIHALYCIEYGSSDAGSLSLSLLGVAER